MEYKMTSSQRRFVVVFTVANTVLAAAHLLPPSARFFAIERAFLAVARILQGLIELLAFAILKISGSPSPAMLFFTISLLAFIIAYLCRKIHFGNDVFPALFFIYILIGLASVYAGNILVSPSTSCEIEISPTVIQEVVVYDELGWNPGAYYFLLERSPSDAAWQQVEWLRLDQPISNPCESINTVFRSGR